MPNLIHRARKNIVLKFLSEGLNRSLAIIFVIVTARYLGDNDYGKYSLAYFFAGLITVFIDLGLNTILIRDVSRDPPLLTRYAGNIFSIKIMIGLVLLLLAPGFLWGLGYSKDFIFMILLSIIYMLGVHLLEFFVALTNSLEKMEYELLIRGLYKVITVGLPIFSLWLGYGLWGLLGSLIGAYGFSCLLSIWFIRKKMTPLTFRWELILWKRFLRSAWPIGLSTLFMTVYARIDMVLLSLFGISAAQIGWYAVPVKIMEMFSLFPLLIMGGLFPIFSVLTVEDREILKRSYQKALVYLTLVSIPLVLTTIFLVDSWVVIFFGPAFAESAPSLKILIKALPFMFLNYVLIITLISLNHEKMITWGSGAAILFNVLANILILPKYGYLGASWTTVATEVMVTIIYLGFLQRNFFQLPLLQVIWKMGLSGALMSLSLWGLKPFSPVASWIIGFLVYVLTLIFLHQITREDWLFIKRVLGQPLTKTRIDSGSIF